MTFKNASLVPPSKSDISKIAYEAIASLPQEFLDFAKNMIIKIQDFPDEETIFEMGLDSPFDLLARLEKASDFIRGWETNFSDAKNLKQSFAKQDTLYLYRRALLDYWCETSEDFTIIVKKAIIGELGNKMGICDDDIAILEDDFYSFFNNKTKK